MDEKGNPGRESITAWIFAGDGGDGGGRLIEDKPSQQKYMMNANKMNPRNTLRVMPTMSAVSIGGSVFEKTKGIYTMYKKKERPFKLFWADLFYLKNALNFR